MALVIAHKNRGISRNIAVTDKDGVTIVLGLQDQLRVSIGRIGEAPVLVIKTDDPTVNGSSITKGATANLLRIDASDLTFNPGIYSMFVEMYRSSDGVWMNVDRQMFALKAPVVPV